MRCARSRSAIAGALLVVVLSSVVGCSSGTPDDVLWRQVAAVKDPFGTALRAAVGTEHRTFIAGLKGGSSVLPGHYWDGSSSPGDLKLAKGGLVYFDLLDGSQDVKFDVLISSGPRNPAADPLADSKPYGGPSAIYTCFVVTVEFDRRAATGFTFEDAACESRLVGTLGGAEFYPVDDFSG